jgi:3-oxoacyl-[acyl-carrier-protein] synthase-3
MALFSIAGLRVTGMCAALPARQVHNQDLDLLKGAGGKDFDRAVGIRTRRVACPTLCASDLCVAAAARLLDSLGVSPEEVGALVFVTQTPDYPLPGNSTLAQHRLGLRDSTFLLDVNQGCAGYVYGLAALAGLMGAARIGKGLLLVGDTITRLVSPRDRSTLPIFSDAGSATLLEADPNAPPMHFSLGGEGRGADIIRVRAGGAREPFGLASLEVGDEEPDAERAPVNLSMRGLDVLHYSLKYVEPSIRELLAFAGVDVGTPDYYVFHQANRLLNECLRKRLGLPAEKAPETLADYGNTSCATIPLTICVRLAAELAQGSRTLLLAGFGAGFSWGNAYLTAHTVGCPTVLELGEAHA